MPKSNRKFSLKVQSLMSRWVDFTEISVRFLGIWIDDQLSFSGHLENLKLMINSGS